MRHYAKDSFDMPHNEGVKATVERLDAVVFDRNLFGGFDAYIYKDGCEKPETVSRIGIAISDPWIRNKLGLDGCGGAYPTDEDVLLWCERFGEDIKWYRVTYGYSN